jgi:hypothetical protein
MLVKKHAILVKKLEYAIFGGIGAISPDILLLYSKRFTMPSLEFSSIQFIVATLLYVGLAAVVSMIFPYRGQSSPWKAFSVGFCLPVILSGLLSIQRDPLLTPKGGAKIPGTLTDIMSLY